MALGTASGCINHPGIEAVGRCKQCGRPYCGSCKVQGPTGYFCSDACKGSHEKFTERAQRLDKMSRTGGLTVRLMGLLKKAVFWSVLALVAAGVATYFGFNVPVLGEFLKGIVNR